MRGASATFSEEICLSEGCGGLSEGSAVPLRRFCGAPARVRGIFRGFSGVATLCL